MGWVWLGGIGVVAFLLLWRCGVPAGLGWFSAAALMIGAAGYALQQHASLPGHPVKSNAAGIDVDPGMVAFRSAIMPKAPGDDAILAAADQHLREGSTDAAVQDFLTAIDRRPDDAGLWTGLGGALAAHDGGQVSPAAQLAFRRAVQLAPDQPGPPFFLGLAFVQTGDLARTKLAWLHALALTPRDAPYRIDIAERLAMIDQFAAMVAAQPAAPRS